MKLATKHILAIALATVALAAHSSRSAAASDSTAIRPFRNTFPDEALVDLRKRIAATRWPDKETVNDDTQGVQLATVQALAQYWATDYDWRKVEAKLNALPQFITEIDGLDIHFIHVRSKHEKALPIIITHGWPGSIIEQMKIIDPLTNPTVHGGRAEDAFDVVIPSMPGYGFSGKPTTTGWDTVRIARAWDVLMKRLGYSRYVAQGGDWGALVVDEMGVLAPPELLAIHTNMAGVIPPDIDKAAQSGAPAPAGLSAEEKSVYERLKFVYTKGIAYGYQLGLRPQSVTGIADSPIGLAAYLLDHDKRSYELIARAFAGQPGGLTRDDVLDNTTLTWLTNSAISSSRLYWENKLPFFAVKGVSVPVAVSAFPDELYQAPRSWAERAYPKLMYYNKLDKGGHFAAWEQPALFTEELRAAFKSLRTVAARSGEMKPAQPEVERTRAIPTSREVPAAKPQPPAKIVVDAPLPEALARGAAYLAYRTENLRIMPVFGPKALEISPRIGHLHVTVDDAPWHWAETSGNPLIVGGLSAGSHKVEFELVDANHQFLDRSVVEFVIPEKPAAK